MNLATDRGVLVHPAKALDQPVRVGGHLVQKGRQVHGFLLLMPFVGEVDVDVGGAKREKHQRVGGGAFGQRF